MHNCGASQRAAVPLPVCLRKSARLQGQKPAASSAGPSSRSGSAGADGCFCGKAKSRRRDSPSRGTSALERRTLAECRTRAGTGREQARRGRRFHAVAFRPEGEAASASRDGYFATAIWIDPGWHRPRPSPPSASVATVRPMALRTVNKSGIPGSAAYASTPPGLAAAGIGIRLNAYLQTPDDPLNGYTTTTALASPDSWRRSFRGPTRATSRETTSSTTSRCTG